MMSMALDDRILTVEDLAAFLKLSEATIYRMAQAGELPARRIGRSWRFSQAQIHEWFREQGDGGGAARPPMREEMVMN